jgi:CRP-like cAMP-binding protein
VAGKVAQFRRNEAIFSQGDDATSILYIQRGGVKVTVVNKAGKEAIVAILGPGDFLGETCLADQSHRMGTAAAMTPCTVFVIQKKEMARVLHAKHSFSDRFISYMLARNIQIEEDLVDQFFNHSEKRLARALLLLARYGKEDQPRRVLHKVSRQMLAGMIGTTLARIDFFMNKFRKLGFINYDRGLHVNNSLLSVVLHE